MVWLWLALLHAWKTDRLKSFICGVTNGTFNDIFFMFMPFCDNFWQAQGSVMISPPDVRRSPPASFSMRVRIGAL